MTIVVVTGAARALGRRVCALAAADPDVSTVVGLDRDDLVSPLDGVDARRIDLLTDDLTVPLAGADTLVHLASDVGPEPSPGGLDDVTAARRLFDAATSAGVGSLIVLSSATAYGAWPSNPVPISEDAPLRPNPDLAYAVQKAEIERLLGEWRDANPGGRTAVLRPAPTLAEVDTTWIASALAANVAIRVGENDPPAQFVHLDDLAAAFHLVRRRGLSGPYNVAPDGWLAGPELAALAARPRVKVTERFARRVSAARLDLGLAPTPPGLVPYTAHPWVVANDRLRAEGWEPAYTNAEAYVAGTDPAPWEAITPKRRQELALGVAAGGVAALAAATAWLVRRHLRN